MTAGLDGLRRFDRLTLGERRSADPVTLSESEITAFARQFDPQWFHCDPVAAQASAFGGVIASGAHLIALWRRLDHAMNGDIAYQCGVALERVAFRLAVRPGDSVTLHSEIVALRASSIEGRGVVTMDYRMTNQRDDAVLTLTAINLVYR